MIYFRALVCGGAGSARFTAGLGDVECPSPGNGSTSPIPAGVAQVIPRAPFHPLVPCTQPGVPSQALLQSPGWVQAQFSPGQQHSQVCALRPHSPAAAAAAATKPPTSLAPRPEPFPTPGGARQGPHRQFLAPQMHSSAPGEIESLQKTECKGCRTKNPPKKCHVSSGLPPPSCSASVLHYSDHSRQKAKLTFPQEGLNPLKQCAIKTEPCPSNTGVVSIPYNKLRKQN